MTRRVGRPVRSWRGLTRVSFELSRLMVPAGETMAVFAHVRPARDRSHAQFLYCERREAISHVRTRNLIPAGEKFDPRTMPARSCRACPERRPGSASTTFL